MKAVGDGLLVQRLPLVVRAEQVRFLYVTPEVSDGLDGNNQRLAHCPMREMEKLISIYGAGHLIRASLNGDDKKRPEFERLRDLDEVWAICARKPLSQQVRIFGRFADKGKFIGLDIHERRLLGGRQNYHAIASRIPEKWKAIFGDFEALVAPTSEGYLGGLVHDVDEAE